MDESLGKKHESGATIVLASHNRGKMEEIRRLLPGWVRMLTATEADVRLPEETGATFAENALLKARAAAAQSGHIAIADDSGLEVDALGGAPGVHSARFAGEPTDDTANNRLLLQRLAGVAPQARTGRFRCVIAIVLPDGTEHLSEGAIAGAILERPRGHGGFGYDPLFQPRGDSRSMAEMTSDEKNRISHRGQALRRATGWLTPRLERAAPEAGRPRADET